jgi:translation initiation factor eIF-2B subunit beta
MKSPEELLSVVRALGQRLVRARPVELVVGNVFRRVLHMIREEYYMIVMGAHELAVEEGRAQKLDMPETSETSFDPKKNVFPSREVGNYDLALAASKCYEPSEGWNLAPEVAGAISEMIRELENVREPISKQAPDHIHAEDVVLVYGHSRTVGEFLISAKRKRDFKVIVAEAAPECSGRQMATFLSQNDIPTTFIPDSAIFALMPSVKKVLLGTHAVMANGGLMSTAGSHLLAQAAKHHAVPVLCVTPLYKLCPLFPYNRDSFIDLKSPGPTSSYAQLGGYENVQVVSPSIDYVPPELVSILVTDTGGHQPSYVYRLLAESYDIYAEDEL